MNPPCPNDCSVDFAEAIRIDKKLYFPHRVAASPMEGVMSPVFCDAAHSLGLIEHWITPFITVGENSIPSPGALRRYAADFRSEHPLIVQVSGHEKKSIAETARRLAGCGIAGINLNFACPSPKVTGSGNGGACLKNPRLIYEILKECVEHAPDTSVSVKLRSGWSSAEEMKDIAAAVRDSGVPFAICHFRTVEEQYRRVDAPLERLAAFVSLLGSEIVVFGNGDIGSFADAKRMKTSCGCAGVAIGRALLYDPFILHRIIAGDERIPTEEERFLFLKTVFSASSLHARSSGRWKRNGFLECVRMSLGAETPLFKRIARMTFPEMETFFLHPADALSPVSDEERKRDKERPERRD